MAYSVHLEQFDGPLDLLLHLIERTELDIKDIFVSEITSQYLACMSETDSLDMDTASEFLTMAATLLYIKSRQLLPRPPREDEGEEEDPEAMLIRQLREYKAFKEASASLLDLFNAAKASFSRLPEDVPLPPKEVALDGASMDTLYTAFLTLLNRKQEAPTAPRAHHVRPDHYTVRNQMRKIRDILVDKPSALFEDLFSEDAERLEMIVTFMALLEMILHGEIILRQKSPFAPIRIAADRLLLEGDDDFDYMDELTD